MLIKLSDFLVQHLVDIGITDVFLVNGGSCSHIIDSIGLNKSIRYTCFQHEQAAAMAADAYYRTKGKIAVTLSTSGPGATNIITGLCCSWFDSIPSLIISGQVNMQDMKKDKKIRQLGFQEMNIIEIIRSVTKYSKVVQNPTDIQYQLDKAIHIATSGRPGPVWLDIPLNIQHSQINSQKLRIFAPQDESTNIMNINHALNKMVKLIEKSARPIILAGNGIHASKSEKIFKLFIKKCQWPVVTSWLAKDILEDNHPLNIGTIGVYGTRGANLSIQNSDLLLSIGSRLDSRQTGENAKTFAKAAKKIVVDIDMGELTKKTIHIDIPIQSDIKKILKILMTKHILKKNLDITRWKKRCIAWKKKYPIVLPQFYKQKNKVNPYVFIQYISRFINPSSKIVVDIGATTAWVMQAFQVKNKQRIISALGLAPMGYGLPAAIGSSLATQEPVIAFIGDGGMQVNIQELQTVLHNKLPIKIFVFNNRGYGILKQFQDIYFSSRYTASGHGYSTPHFRRIATAYGLTTEYISTHKDFYKIPKILALKKAVLCEINIATHQKIIPKLQAKITPNNEYVSNPLENQWPYLPKKELLENMIIDKVIS